MNNHDEILLEDCIERAFFLSQMQVPELHHNSLCNELRLLKQQAEAIVQKYATLTKQIDFSLVVVRSNAGEIA